MKPRVLVAGNSHAGCVKQAHDRFPPLLKEAADVYFYVIPGGLGPDFNIVDDRLVVESFVEKFPPYSAPTHTPSIAVSRYDAVVVSALGYIDGGFLYQSPALMQGLLCDFSPKTNAKTSQLISKECCELCVRGVLESQPGFRFLKKLRANFAGKILVQPVPLLSPVVAERPEWFLNQLYAKPLEANQFFQRLRQRVVQELCEQLGVELLGFPQAEWLDQGFTPEHLIKPHDGIHTTTEYGKLVIEQVAAALN